jgi:penicillin-binding protein 1C
MPPRDSLAPHLAARLLKTPGERLVTTLDAELQAFAVATLADHLAELAPRGVGDGAIVVLDNASGEVLAWVGSSGPLSRAPQVDGVVAPRQAGSTLKPFLYALALDERRLTAASLVDDSPLAIATARGVYAPQNYDRGYRGLVTVRTALASSLNIPAVRTLDLVGLDRFHDTLRALGFDTLSQPDEHYGAALALGGADVTLLALTNAYRRSRTAA